MFPYIHTCNFLIYPVIYLTKNWRNIMQKKISVISLILLSLLIFITQFNFLDISFCIWKMLSTSFILTALFMQIASYTFNFTKENMYAHILINFVFSTFIYLAIYTALPLCIYLLDTSSLLSGVMYLLIVLASTLIFTFSYIYTTYYMFEKEE